MRPSHNQTVMNRDFSLKIEHAIWGASGAQGDESNLVLDSFFKYCQREMRQAVVLAEIRPEQLEAILSVFAILKSNYDKPKGDLGGILDNPAVLDLGLRMMLMTGCRDPGTFGGDIFRPRWKEDESLAQYVERVYPRHDGLLVGRGESQAFSLYKLRANYLRSYAAINIRWTDHLTDHLLLLKGSNWKTLYIFAHPGFALKSLQALSSGSAQNNGDPKAAQDWADSLSRGCLSPGLLGETLATLEILFPPVGDTASRRILAREVRQHGLDQTLLQPLLFQSSDHESLSDIQRLTDVHELSQRFPFWADRLHSLWAEAEEPTPTTYIGKLAERKKSPRFTYWCGVVALSVAVMFGIVSTVLGALQVWISYCSWMDDPSVRGCELKGKGGSGGKG